jgi:hypothetical protein
VERLLGEALTRKNYNPDDVEAGRSYLRAYVALVHHAEQLRAPGHPNASTHGHH